MERKRESETRGINAGFSYINVVECTRVNARVRECVNGEVFCVPVHCVNVVTSECVSAWIWSLRRGARGGSTPAAGRTSIQATHRRVSTPRHVTRRLQHVGGDVSTSLFTRVIRSQTLKAELTCKRVILFIWCGERCNGRE